MPDIEFNDKELDAIKKIVMEYLSEREGTWSRSASNTPKNRIQQIFINEVQKQARALVVKLFEDEEFKSQINEQIRKDVTEMVNERIGLL